MEAGGIESAAPVLALVRYRKGEVGNTRRGVHGVDLAQQHSATAWVALCEQELDPRRCETVEPGVGMPCEGCLPAMARLAGDAQHY